MAPKETRIVLANADKPDQHTLEGYLSRGGYRALRKALFEMSPGDVIEEVKASGLRGRGGAGFPTGLKWAFVPKDVPGPKYVVVNADEGEPGTFKDRDILNHDPHLVLEGAIIAAYAIGAHDIYIYLRAEYQESRRKLERAIREAREKGFLGPDVLGSGFSVEAHLYLGAGAYICGEETALLESIEGKRGFPRLKPPYPATHGLFGRPTVVNNVETLANVPHIIEKGARWFRGYGTEKSPGTKIFSVSGAVNRPGNYEFPMGALTLRELVFEVAGGLPEGRTLVGVIPGGISTPVLREGELDVPLDFESMAQAGSMLGSGAVIVLDDTLPLTTLLRRSNQFFAHESCGKCTPCREGTPWLTQILRRIERGEGEERDLALLRSVASLMKGRCFCPLGESAALTTLVFLDKYPEVFVREMAAFRERREESLAGLAAH